MTIGAMSWLEYLPDKATPQLPFGCHFPRRPSSALVEFCIFLPHLLLPEHQILAHVGCRSSVRFSHIQLLLCLQFFDDLRCSACAASISDITPWSAIVLNSEVVVKVSSSSCTNFPLPSIQRFPQLGHNRPFCCWVNLTRAPAARSAFVARTSPTRKPRWFKEMPKHRTRK